jgi:site-specific DNA-methyltransferase (adenine-specific)
MNNELMFSSKSAEWYTPIDFFKELDKEFNFNLDPCATDYNKKCDNYYTIADDGLTKNWGGVQRFL